MTSSVEWLNGTPRADFAILTFARSTTAQLKKNKFSILVQWSYYINYYVHINPNQLYLDCLSFKLRKKKRGINNDGH